MRLISSAWGSAALLNSLHQARAGSADHFRGFSVELADANDPTMSDAASP